MSEKQAIICFGVIMIGMVWWIASIGARNAALSTRIQALEQSQCSTKQDKIHADYKLNVCIAQLRSKP